MIFGPVLHPSSTELPEICIRLVKDQMIKWALSRKGENLDEWNVAVPEFAIVINTRFVPSRGYNPSIAFLRFEPRKKIITVTRFNGITPEDYNTQIIDNIVGLRVEK